MTTNRNSWSPKEQEVLLKILEKNKEFVLTYSFELAAKKLNRSLSAISQYYYYHKNKIEKQSLNKQFKTLVRSGKYKLTKKGNLFIVEI
jgi:hypothetical protein